MEFMTIFFIAVGLAMDAFAVSVSNGVSVRDFQPKHSVEMGFYFGGFQFLMPIIGWYLGSGIKSYIEVFDHWIAFILLVLIGINMLIETFKSNDDTVCYVASYTEVFTMKKLIIQAVATSIDALAIGISFAILDINILYASCIIGVVAFVFSFCGGILGRKLGDVYKKKAELMGGVILIGIGVKILVEHTFFV